MTRSYTGKDGELVEVSDLHLDTAIQIKNELQKASPSRRTSWAKHKRMMESEGFYDSENSENYRQMIKHEQKARGVLTAVEKHADMVSVNKLESIKQEIGEIRESKFEAQDEFRKLNKMKRELSRDIVLIEGIERALSEKDYSKPIDFTPVYQPELKKKDMILAISDVHYGAHVDVEGRYYDSETAKRLLNEYVDKALVIAEDNNVENIYVVGLGDYFEHSSMRVQNSFDAERTLTEQVADFTDIIIEALLKLSKYANVQYSAIGGNHDRMNPKKTDSLYGEHMVSISNKIVQTFVKYSKNERIQYIEAEPYHHIVKMNDRNFLFVHGDRTPMAKKSVLAEQSILYGIPFDAIFAGHIHHFTMKEVSDDKYVVTFGSIKGSDEYTLKTINTSASRSQGVILVDEDGEYEIKQVKL